MMMSEEEILHLAELARIELNSDEVQPLREQIQAILGYVERLTAIDTASVSPHVFLSALEGTLAQDSAVLTPVSEREALVQAFPDRLGQLLRVPGIFEHPKKS